MRRVAVIRWTGVAVATALMAGSAEAQRRPHGHDRDDYDRQDYGRGPGGYIGFGIIGADPIGELGYHIDQGVGAQFEGAFPIEPTGHLRLRADFGFVVYGHERQYLCFSTPIGCRIGLDLTTTNSILFGGLGPEFVLAHGPVEPYVNASFGFAWFGTTSSLSGDADYYYDEFASSTNYSDGMFAWRVGGGMRLRVRGGRKPIHLDFGVERHENGVADFLTEGDIVDHPDGSITIYPRRSEADLLTYRLGVSFGVGRRRGG